MKLFNKKFVVFSNKLKLKKFNNISSIQFLLSKDANLHLGDELYLSEIVEKLNSFSLTSKYKVYLTLQNRGINSDYLQIALDWSSEISLSPEEVIRFEFNKIGITFPIFDIKDKNKIIFFNSEIRSNKLRVFGMKKKFLKLLETFHNEKFEIISIGKEKPYWIENNGIPIKEHITGLEKCQKAIETLNPFAIVTFDNYWMHYAGKIGLRRYVVQRRKLFQRNLINHITLINNLTNNSNIYYI